jgi:tetratricopeptide (TPR) repeat protein
MARCIPAFISLSALAVCYPASPAWAQHEDHAAAGAASERLGSVSFDNSCDAEVGTEFNRAVALLHSFEFRSAIEGFDRVLGADESCAIAHWGIALSYWGNPFGGARSTAALDAGLAAVNAGRALGTATARESAYIEAVAALFEDHASVAQRDRILAYAERMEQVARANPRDVEAQIFHALAVNQTALPTDKTYAAQLAAAGILEPLFARHPDHPGLAHYIIHAYDHPPLAERALGAARSYAEIAPSAPHALHMPSHTFTRVGSWQESVDTNRRSEQTALTQGSATEALHAMDYQTYAHLQMAQDAAALEVLTRLPEVEARFDATAVTGGAAPPMAGFYALAAIPARYALERGAWSEAAELEVPTAGTPFTIAIAHFARALGAARSGQPDAAAGDIGRLRELRDALRAAQDDYWAEQVDIQLRVANAWMAFAQGRREEALAAMRAAADAEDATDKSAVTPGPLAPARELLGEMLLEAGDAAGALAAFESSMVREPRRFRGAYGAARAAESAGDAAAARRYYERALEIVENADSDRAEIAHARDFVDQGA